MYIAKGGPQVSYMNVLDSILYASCASKISAMTMFLILQLIISHGMRVDTPCQLLRVDLRNSLVKRINIHHQL